jgi:hypothetical protein
MTDRNLPRPAGDVVEDGVPATEEVRDEQLQTDDPGVADMPMPDHPLGADEWGITDFEERHGDPLSRRVERELPDFGEGGSEDGRRIPESGVDDRDVGRYDTLSAEEAAMHVEPERP